MPNKTKRTASRKCQLEKLESRALMATFGQPWPEPRSLSISFPTDQAAIGGYTNTLRQSLDQVADRLAWQEAVLRAFQTWAVQSNINIGLVPDRGDDFGTVGLSSNDPRFGEFRIGAFPQENTLANALPFQPQAGTWSGDVLLNSDTRFFLADPNVPRVTVPPPNQDGPAFELFSVLLHEAGNALGIADNNVPGAVMNGRYTTPNRTLKASDIASLRQLYGGSRRDVFEPVTNNTLARATVIRTPAGYDAQQPLAIAGSLNTVRDVDFYRFTPLAGQEKVTVRLVASGISLVKAKLEVLDRLGNKIADAKADSIFQNNMGLEIGSLGDHSSLIIRVASNSTDVFGVGDYRIELDYRDPSLQPSILPPAHDADAIDEVEDFVDYVSVDALFANAGIIDRELLQNDTLTTATILETIPGFLTHSRYEVQSSIASSQDRDLWRFQAPASPSPTLQIEVDPVGTENPTLEVYLLNSQGDRVASRVTRKPDGGALVRIDNPTPSESYILFVRRQASSTVLTGNYVVTVDFATNPANALRPVFSSSVEGAAENLSELQTSKTQLMRFDFTAQASIANDGAQLTIHDARTGDIVAAFAAASGTRRTEFVWLGAGNYILRVQARNRFQGLAGIVNFDLRADTVSDDQGPRATDPTQQPAADWNWQDTPTKIHPFLQEIDPPYIQPWGSDSNQSASNGFYSQL